jgi:DNA-binding NarL/FixJ family response regulator
MKRRLRILLIDINRCRSRLTAAELDGRLDRCSVTLLSDAHSAPDELRQTTFHVVIFSTDTLTGNGLETVRAIRAQHQRLPIIIIGNTAAKTVQARAARSGANRYLVRDSSLTDTLPEAVQQLTCPSQPTIKRRPSDEVSTDHQTDLIRITARTLYHEVNNPLMTILGVIELILDNCRHCDPDVARKIKIIRSSARRIQSTLSRLSNIKLPAIKDTVSGKMIDPGRSSVKVPTASGKTFSLE